MTLRGLRVSDPEGNQSTLTTRVSTIISAGSVSMPSSLNGDGTYGVDIDLPGTSAIAQAKLAVLVTPRNFSWGITQKVNTLDGNTQNIGYMSSAKTYYTRDALTGILSTWSAGNLTVKTPSTYDHIAAIFPIAFWDLLGASSFTAIRLFAATCYLIYDSSSTEYKKVYSIGTNGVSSADYMISMLNYNGG